MANYLEDSLIAKMVGTAAITALTAQRIYYMGHVPQDVTAPYVVIQSIDDLPRYAHDGNANLKTARIQISCYSTSYLTTKQVKKAIVDALDCFTGAIGAVTVQSLFFEDGPDDFDPDSKLNGAITDALITYST